MSAVDAVDAKRRSTHARHRHRTLANWIADGKIQEFSRKIQEHLQASHPIRG